MRRGAESDVPRIVGIVGYTHPPEAYLHESEGGRVPDGFNIWNDSPRTIPQGQEPQIGDLNQSFKQWRYESFYQADLRAFVDSTRPRRWSDDKGEQA